MSWGYRRLENVCRFSANRHSVSGDSPAYQKRPDTQRVPGLFWCERWDSNPHGVTTRTSNVLVYHSNTLANAWLLYSGGEDLSTIFFCDELQKNDRILCTFFENRLTNKRRCGTMIVHTVRKYAYPWFPILWHYISTGTDSCQVLRYRKIKILQLARAYQLSNTLFRPSGRKKGCDDPYGE